MLTTRGYRFCWIALIFLSAMPGAAQIRAGSTSELTLREAELKVNPVLAWTPQPVTTSKFKAFVLADQDAFKTANNLPDAYSEKRRAIAEPLAMSTGERLEKHNVVLDQESMKAMLALVSKASGRLVGETKNSEKYKAAQQALARVVDESSQTASATGESRYVTTKDIQSALFRICPLYPICP